MGAATQTSQSAVQRMRIATDVAADAHTTYGSSQRHWANPVGRWLEDVGVGWLQCARKCASPVQHGQEQHTPSP